jgi:hypothetical protein
LLSRAVAAGMDKSERSPKTYHLDEAHVDDVRELRLQREQRERGSFSDADLANEALELGVAALELFEERAPDLSPQARKAIVRQAVLDELRESEE